jgi:hypothetical protein
MTIAPISLEVLMSEVPDDAVAWVLQDQTSQKYVTVPDSRYKGKRPVRFFLSKADADDVLSEILKVSETLQGANIKAVQVKLKLALKSLADENRPNMADSFVVHSPNEVFEFLRDRL